MAHKYQPRSWGSNPKTVNDAELEGYQAVGTSVAVDVQLTSVPTKFYGCQVMFGIGALADIVTITDSASTAGADVALINNAAVTTNYVEFWPTVPINIKNGLFIGITTATAATEVVINAVYK